MMVLATTGCSSVPNPVPETHVPAHWSYEGADGPATWNKLDPEYAFCGFGTTQSPVDIAKPETHNLPEIVFHYQTSKLKIQNVGYTARVTFDEGSSIEANGESYDLEWMELHVPSEHRIHGKLADGELQLFHKNTSGQLAAVAVLLKIGAESETLRAMWDNVPFAPGPGKTIEGTINVEDILPADRRTYRYEGSLTVPPCTEIVSWLVMRDAMHVSSKQLAGFTSIFGKNNRPVQLLNHRTVIQDSSSK